MSTNTSKLEPIGKLVRGQPGVSATRIAEFLDVPAAVIKRLVRPVGVMKMSRRSPFQVYDPALVSELESHPEIGRARERRRKRAGSDAGYRGTETRKDRCVDALCSLRPDLEWLYGALVERLWNPSSEQQLRESPLYRELLPLLWEALAPCPDTELEGRDVVIDILWAMTKTRTWKVNEDGDQDEPLAWELWRMKAPVDSNLEKYANVFAAAIRHLWFDDPKVPKFERRQLAVAKLRELSSREWPPAF